jgi:hypothetical protein
MAVHLCQRSQLTGHENLTFVTLAACPRGRLCYGAESQPSRRVFLACRNEYPQVESNLKNFEKMVFVSLRFYCRTYN